MLPLQESSIRQDFCHASSTAREQGKIGSLVKPSLRAIQEQAKLFRDARDSKEWASQNKKLTLKQSGLHDVYPLLGKKGSDTPLTYFKQGDFERFMEVIVWDIAVLFGWEDLFTPTKMDKLYVDQLLMPRGKTILTVDCKETMQGSIQRSLHGVVYDEWDVSRKINTRSLINCFLAMYVLGLNDVHANNLFVQKNGSFRLFDNTKCLPPGNTWILTLNEIFPVHRFVLFERDECDQPLSPNVLELMRQKVLDCKNRLPSIVQYFQSDRLVKIEKILPEHWLKREKSLFALTQRLERLEVALNSKQEWTLYTLFEELYPQYRFTFLITMIYAIHLCSSIPETKEGIFKFTHSCVGGFGLTDIFCYLLKKGYSLPLIQNKANDPSKSLKELANWIVDNPEEVKIELRTEKEKVRWYIEIYKWLKQFRRIPRDYKDTDESLVEPHTNREVLSNVCSRFLTSIGFGNYQEGKRSELDAKHLKKHKRPYFYKAIDEKKWYAVYTDRTYEDLTSMVKNRDQIG